MKVKLLTITSAAFPFVGVLPAKSQRFRRVFSSPELGTSGPEYVHGFARRELRKVTESGRQVKECVESGAAGWRKVLVFPAVCHGCTVQEPVRGHIPEAANLCLLRLQGE